MVIDETAFNNIATSLAKHFDSLYYVDIETGEYTQFVNSKMFNQIPKKEKNFFEMSVKKSHQYVHSEDLDAVLKSIEKDILLTNLSKSKFYSIPYRLIINGKIFHVRSIDIMCEDKKHIIFGTENVEDEFQKKAEQERNLLSAERMARRDELTGIKNKNAFTEFTQSLDNKIAAESKDLHFGIVMCDVNNLKIINDTRGHNFGDETIQRTSRLICEIFKHSPVFRIGGDEFVAVISDSDYKNRDRLIHELKNESIENLRSRSGPIVACGLSIYDPEKDKSFCSVFERADREMYENKNELKSINLIATFRKMDSLEKKIPPERKRMLDSLFGALITVVGDGYIYINDMNYDFSRWSLSLVDDFGLNAEYMYHADKIWEEYIHPEDIIVYKEAVNAVLCGNAEVKQIFYRARKPDGKYVTLTTRGFVLTDAEGNPDYFGGIIIPQQILVFNLKNFTTVLCTNFCKLKLLNLS